MAAAPSLDTVLAGDARRLVGKYGQGVGHAVDGVGEGRDLPLRLEGQLASQVAVCDRGDDARDASHLVRQVGGHQVDVVGEVLPRAGDALDVGLTSELAVGADLTRDTHDFTREGVQLVDHRVDGVLELENLPLAFDRDLLGDVAVGDRSGDLGDVAYLAREVAGHGVDVVGEVFPRAGDTLDLSLAAELAVGADLARDVCGLVGKGVELVDHRVDGVLELQDLALNVDRDLLGGVVVGTRGREGADVVYLAREVAGHGVDVVGEVLPRAGDTLDLSLAAELAVGANFARHTRHLVGEGVELVDHRVDGVLELQDLPLAFDRDLLREVALGDRGRHLGDVADLAGEVAGHEVDVVRELLPRAGDALDVGLAAELALGADLASDAGHLVGESVELIDHRVDGVLELEDLALDVDSDLLGEVAVGDRGRHLGDVPHLTGEVAGHQVDVVGQVFPYARDASHLGLTAELALGADLARDARDLLAEGPQLVDHRIHGAGCLQELSLQAPPIDVHRYGLREVTVCDGADDSGHLAVGTHDVIDQVIDGVQRRRPRAPR